MRRLDDFLIERVFQKIADALCRWRSCYGIAAFLLTGGSAVLVGVGAFTLIRFENWLLLAFLPLMGFWSYHKTKSAYDLDAAWHQGKEALPVDRIRDAVLRVVWLVIMVFHGTQVLLLLETQTALSLAYYAGWCLFTFGLYFLACTPKRPRQQIQRELAWGSSR